MIFILKKNKIMYFIYFIQYSDTHQKFTLTLLRKVNTRKRAKHYLDLCVRFIKIIFPSRIYSRENDSRENKETLFFTFCADNNNIWYGIYFFTTENIDDFLVYRHREYKFGPIPRRLCGKTAEEIHDECTPYDDWIYIVDPYKHCKHIFPQSKKENWEIEHGFTYAHIIDDTYGPYKDMIQFYIDLKKVKSGLAKLVATIVDEKNLPKDICCEIMKHIHIDTFLQSAILKECERIIHNYEEDAIDENTYPKISMEDFQLISV